MTATSEPLVHVLTPVYNGADYIRECIDSVLSQTYSNWKYTIINNRSTDQTLAIAEEYAARDPRIEVMTNDRFVEVIENHNIAFRLLAPNAKYCKVVSADDFLFPDCVTQLVALAEANPSIGIVGCFQLSRGLIRWQGFEYPTTVWPGKELCRRMFLGRDPEFGFGSPTSLLYRTDVVRRTPDFYPNPSPHSDTSACFASLVDTDFGFVYQVLSYERTHEATQSSASIQLNRYASAYLNDLIQYGSFFLTEQELSERIKEELDDYDRFLARSILSTRDPKFWNYHRSRLAELGHPVSTTNLVTAAIKAALREIANPGIALGKLAKRLKHKTA